MDSSIDRADGRTDVAAAIAKTLFSELADTTEVRTDGVTDAVEPD